MDNIAHASLHAGPEDRQVVGSRKHRDNASAENQNEQIVKCSTSTSASLSVELYEAQVSKHNVDRMSDDPSESLIRAVRSGDLESAEKLIDTYGLSYAEAWSNGYDLLCHALQRKHPNVAKMLLMRGAEVNKKTKGRKGTPLLFATKYGYEEIVSMLLKRKADVHAESSVGVTALYRAAVLGYLEIARELLIHGARVNISITVSRDKGYTPLHHAICRGKMSLVKLLLNAGADMNAKTVSHETPLQVATKMRREKAVKILLEAGANVDSLGENDESVLHVAVKESDLSIVKLILRYRPNINSKANRKSFYAALLQPVDCVDHLDIVGSLVRYGFNIYPADAKDVKLFHLAVKWDYIEVVKSFLKFGTDIHSKNDTGLTAIEYAIGSGRGELTELLWKAGARIRLTKELFWSVVDLGDCSIVETLLNRADTLNLNAIDYTAVLHSMLRSNNGDCSARAKIVSTLISRGADVNAKTESGYTSLHLAAGYNYPKIVKLLLENGANIDDMHHFHRTTALHDACQSRCVDVVKLLVEQNADLEVQDYYKKTALHHAAEKEFDHILFAVFRLTRGANGLEEIALRRAALAKLSFPVKILLDHGADVNSTCKDSMTPLDYATRYASEYYSVKEDYHADSAYNDAARISIEMIKNHIIALMAVGLYVSEKNIKAIEQYKKRHDILEHYQTEVSIMKAKKIGCSNVTFHSFLIGSTIQLVSYARNDNIIEALETTNLSGEFPTYSRMITRRIKQGIKRKNLLDSGFKALNALSGYVLPDLPAIELSTYLSDKDLENLTNADLSDGSDKLTGNTIKFPQLSTIYFKDKCII